jgi:HEPN domain-containing protein
MNITKYVNDWFEKGGEDLDVAEVLLKERGSPNPVCFHAQQSAENTLKAFLPIMRNMCAKYTILIFC